MVLVKYFSRDTSVPKPSSSLTQKEKEIIRDLASKAEKEDPPHPGIHSQNAIFNSANKKPVTFS